MPKNNCGNCNIYDNQKTLMQGQEILNKISIALSKNLCYNITKGNQ